MSQGQNRRIVKKSKNKDTMNIKVSTADKDLLFEDKEINIKISGQNKNSKKNTFSTIKEYDNNIVNRINKLIENNIKIEQEIQSINSKIKQNSEKDISQILSLNKQLSQLEKDYNDESKKNKNLLTQLKELENEVAKIYMNKFKISIMIKNQKKNENKNNIKTEIKSKEKQKENIGKYMKYHKKEIQKLNKLLEENKEGDEQKLSNELKEINNNINIIEKEIKELNKIKLQHKLCKNNENLLKCQLNVLKNDCEFESKKGDMIKTKKKEKTKIKNVNMTMKYGEQIRKKMLENTVHKYNSKQDIFNYKSYNFLLKEFDDKKTNIKKGSSYQMLQTEGNVQLPNFKTYLKKNISSIIDNKTPQKYLFSQEEKKVLKKILPDEYYNNYNERYNKFENEITEIEDKLKGNNTIKKKIYLDNIKNEANNLKLKELSYKATNLKVILAQNDKKILDIKKKLKVLNNDIKKQDFIFSHHNDNNKLIRKRIEVIERSKDVQTEEE